MHRLAESKLLAGFIYGDPHMQEYIYLPASELDAASPMLVYETGKERHDVDMQEALSLIEKRSLKPCSHPVFGKIRWDEGGRVQGSGLRGDTRTPPFPYRHSERSRGISTALR